MGTVAGTGTRVAYEFPFHRSDKSLILVIAHAGSAISNPDAATRS